ncbi:hypothetical protein GEMRC1_005975 [Eukaryota sp. GEM-RC1]
MFPLTHPFHLLQLLVQQLLELRLFLPIQSSPQYFSPSSVTVEQEVTQHSPPDTEESLGLHEFFNDFILPVFEHELDSRKDVVDTEAIATLPSDHFEDIQVIPGESDWESASINHNSDCVSDGDCDPHECPPTIDVEVSIEVSPPPPSSNPSPAHSPASTPRSSNSPPPVTKEEQESSPTSTSDQPPSPEEVLISELSSVVLSRSPNPLTAYFSSFLSIFVNPSRSLFPIKIDLLPFDYYFTVMSFTSESESTLISGLTRSNLTPLPSQISSIADIGALLQCHVIMVWGRTPAFSSFKHLIGF